MKEGRPIPKPKDKPTPEVATALSATLENERLRERVKNLLTPHLGKSSIIGAYNAAFHDVFRAFSIEFMAGKEKNPALIYLGVYENQRLFQRLFPGRNLTPEGGLSGTVIPDSTILEPTDADVPYNIVGFLKVKMNMIPDNEKMKKDADSRVLTYRGLILPRAREIGIGAPEKATPFRYVAALNNKAGGVHSTDFIVRIPIWPQQFKDHFDRHYVPSS